LIFRPIGQEILNMTVKDLSYQKVINNLGDNLIRVKLERNGQTILEIPIEEDVVKSLELLENVIKGDITRMVKVFKALSNENRAKMLLELAKMDQGRFKEFVERMRLNPKVVTSNLEMLVKEGLVEKVMRGYRVSKFGISAIVTTMVLLRKIFEEIEEEKRKWRRVKVE